MAQLVIAPHPDDEVLGCGGTIRRYADEGLEIHLCIVTEAYRPDWSEEYLEKKPKEIDESTSILGIDEVHNLGYPAAKLDTVPQKKLNDELSSLVRTIEADTVFLPHYGDIHHDHQIIFNAGLVACRPPAGVDQILAYETLSESEWGIPSTSFDPSVYVDISDCIKEKIEAMVAYESEVREYPHPRSERTIKALMTKRGSEANLEAAEAFELIRERR
jgi:LmbE family N-acetylglucosaminyl deacetylase